MKKTTTARGYFSGKHAKSRLLIVMILGVAAALQAATTNVYWIGQGDGTSWSDAGNWDIGRVPGSNDVVFLGYEIDGSGGTVTNVAQNITVDVEDLSIHSLWLEPTGNRAVTLSSNVFEVLASPAITMTSNATANVVIQQNQTISAAAGQIRNDSLVAELSLGGGSNGRAFYGDGVTRLTSSLSNPTIFYDTTIIADGTWLVLQRATFFGTTIHVAQNSGISRQWYGTHATMAVVESNEDVTFGFSSHYGLDGSDTSRIYFVESPDGSTGNIIAQIRKFNENSVELVTREGTIVEFFRAEDNVMEWADNAGISGGGSLWRTGIFGAFTIKRAMTYTGRTMLQNGTLRLGTHVEDEGTPEEITYYGQLPVTTVVELHPNATLDLNGVDQTIGGLTGFIDRFQPVGATNAAGTVALGGATLTINAASTNTSFAGTITGEGALVKTGAETFTTAGGYTNVAGRTLRVEEGLLAVTGALAIEEGTFELTGGYVTAGILSTTGLTWNVTLGAGYEEEILVDVTDADITGAALILALADGYTPEIGTKFTLLRAEEDILGAGPGGMLFGYQDGQAFQQSGQWFALDWAGGSETIVLTVIPEPGSLALLALATVGLLIRRRFRG